MTYKVFLGYTPEKVAEQINDWLRDQAPSNIMISQTASTATEYVCGLFSGVLVTTTVEYYRKMEDRHD